MNSPSEIRIYDGRRDLRSLADALAKLQELGGLRGQGKVEIKAAGVGLPDGRISGLVAVLGPRHNDGFRSVIQMPASAKFTARTTSGVRQTYEVATLNDAVSDSEGNVQLADGQFLHHVDLIPAPIHYEFTQLHDEIVRHALKFLQAEERCYLPLHEELLPDVKRLHYDAVAKVRIKHLKPLQHYVCRRMPRISPSAVAAALKLAGMKFPRSSA